MRSVLRAAKGEIIEDDFKSYKRKDVGKHGDGREVFEVPNAGQE